MIRNGNEIGLNINIHCNKINYESSYLSEKLIFFRECVTNIPISDEFAFVDFGFRSSLLNSQLY